MSNNPYLLHGDELARSAAECKVGATPKPRAGEHTKVKADPGLLRYWRTLPAPSNEVLACDIIESLQDELNRAQGELTLMKTAGIIEVSLRNPAVSEYINHWERRTEIAEAERDLLRERQRKLVIAVQIAYAILADVRHQWAGRHTVEGQEALAAMRDAIAEATGRDAQQVQDDA